MFVMPIGLENIGWKMYMINGSWDIVIVVLIVGLPVDMHDLVTDHGRLYFGWKRKGRRSKR